MRKIFTVLIIITLAIPGFSQRVKSQFPKGKPSLPEIKSRKVTHGIIDYAGTEGSGLYIPPPQKFLDSKNAKTTGANFSVTYIGFPDSVRTAFQYALNVWGALIDSPVPITVEALWEPLDPGVLGGAFPGTAFTNMFFSRNFDAWHPAALAEKIIGENLNGTDPDIVIQFNSDANWYVRGNTNPLGIADDEFDLITVVMHEIGHGLGFLDFTEYNSGSGSYIWEGKPWIYTTFLENGGGQNLIEDFTNSSTSLGTQFTSNDLWFNENISFTNYGSTRVPVYAPSTYEVGSSIAHLDISISRDGPDALMRPSISPGDVVHDPGVALDMLNDMGWALTFINHDGTPNTEDVVNPKVISASVSSDTDVDSSSFMLIYSSELNEPFADPSLIDTVQFELISKGNFEATVPGFGEPTLYSYYMVINDEYGRTFINPPLAPAEGNYYQFGAAPDDEPPVLVHSPIFFAEQGTTDVPITAFAADFIGIGSVTVEYLIDGSPQGTFDLALAPNTSATYTGSFSLSASLPIGTVISYKVTATDAAVLQNQTSSPTVGLHEFTIIEPVAAVKVYTNDFNAPTEDFLGDLFVGTSATGFSSPALHTEHPYDAGPEGGAINLISELVVPIILDDDSAVMTFDEVALIEPGEPGTTFGQFGFWDFVIVEGSKDNGQNWLPFIEGYDARDNTNWENHYNSGFNQATFNSDAVGNSTLMAQRSIDLLESGFFNPGETVKIRFRLYSDELAVGWGWIIDNLNIQSLVTGIEDVLDEESFSVFPNPTNGMITLKAQLKEPLQRSRIKVTSLLGKTVFTKLIDSRDTRLYEAIDLSNSPDGLYIVTLETPQGRITRKMVKTQY